MNIQLAYSKATNKYFVVFTTDLEHIALVIPENTFRKLNKAGMPAKRV